MDGKLLLAFLGTLLLVGTALANDPVQQNMNTLHKDRRVALVNELMKAQEQISKALWKMYKSTAPPGQQGGPDGPDCSESSESAEEEAYTQMKQKKILEMRQHVNSHVLSVAQNFLSMSSSIDHLDKKVDKEAKDKKSVVNYSLFYNKHPHHGSSEEHSEEHGSGRPQASGHYRSSRQMKDVLQSGAKAEEETEPEEVVKTIDGEEVVQTLPE